MSRFNETSKQIKWQQQLEALRQHKDGTLLPVPLDVIDRTKNIRGELVDTNSTEFNQLIESIKEVGILHPPVITILDDSLVCVSGHRRLAALEKLGETRPHCLLRKLDQLEKKEMAQLLENTVRKALSPLETADQLAKLQSLGYNQTRLQDLIGKDRKTIGRFQKMAEWPEFVKSLIRLHSEKLKTGFLLQLASRSLSDEELVSKIEIQAGIQKKETFLKKPEPTSLNFKINEYFNKKQFSEIEKNIILSAIYDLGLVKKTKYAMGSKIPPKLSEQSNMGS